MKYDKFLEIAILNNCSVTFNEDDGMYSIFKMDYIDIELSTELHFANVRFLGEPRTACDKNILNALNALLLTPINNRTEVKKHHLRLKEEYIWLAFESDVEECYVNVNTETFNREDVAPWLGDSFEGDNFRTKFTDEEIDIISRKVGFKPEMFDKIDVKEEDD